MSSWSQSDANELSQMEPDKKKIRAPTTSTLTSSGRQRVLTSLFTATEYLGGGVSCLSKASFSAVREPVRECGKVLASAVWKIDWNWLALNTLSNLVGYDILVSWWRNTSLPVNGSTKISFSLRTPVSETRELDVPIPADTDYHDIRVSSTRKATFCRWTPNKATSRGGRSRQCWYSQSR